MPIASGRVVPAGSGWVQFEVTHLCPVDESQMSKKNLDHALSRIPMVLWVMPFVRVRLPISTWELCDGQKHLVSPEDAREHSPDKAADERFVCEHMGRFVE